MSEKNMEVFLVYVGRYQRNYCYKEVNKDTLDIYNEEKMYFFKKNLTRNGFIGGIYKLKCDENKESFSVNDFSYIGVFKDENQIKKWKVKDRAFGMMRKDEKRIKVKEMDGLNELRELYRSSNYSKRNEILAEFIRYITNY